MVLIGLDVGTVRVGVAKSDELGMFAHPIGYVDRGKDEDFMQKIKELVATYTAEKVVVGLPLNLDGSHGLAAKTIMQLVDRIKECVPVGVETWDERLSTKGAQRYMQAAPLSGKKKRKKVDSLAAQIMLQNYLDFYKVRNHE